MQTLDYEKQAIDFLKETNSCVKVKFLRYGKYFIEDIKERDIFRVTILRQGKKSYSFNFGQSLNNSTENGYNKPTTYDILACLTKYDVGSFDDFCRDFGYNDYKLSEYPKVLKIYKSVKKEFENVDRLFNDVIDKLQEIQ